MEVSRQREFSWYISILSVSREVLQSSCNWETIERNSLNTNFFFPPLCRNVVSSYSDIQVSFIWLYISSLLLLLLKTLFHGNEGKKNTLQVAQYSMMFRLMT